MNGMLSTKGWYAERVIWLIAGVFVLLSLALGLLVSQYWFILTGLVGLNLTILALTGFCPMSFLLIRTGVVCPMKSNEIVNG